MPEFIVIHGAPVEVPREIECDSRAAIDAWAAAQAAAPAPAPEAPNEETD